MEAAGIAERAEIELPGYKPWELAADELPLGLGGVEAPETCAWDQGPERKRSASAGCLTPGKPAQPGRASGPRNQRPMTLRESSPITDVPSKFTSQLGWFSWPSGSFSVMAWGVSFGSAAVVGTAVGCATAEAPVGAGAVAGSGASVADEPQATSNASASMAASGSNNRRNRGEIRKDVI